MIFGKIGSIVDKLILFAVLLIIVNFAFDLGLFAWAYETLNTLLQALLKGVIKELFTGINSLLNQLFESIFSSIGDLV